MEEEKARKKRMKARGESREEEKGSDGGENDEEEVLTQQTVYSSRPGSNRCRELEEEDENTSSLETSVFEEVVISQTESEHKYKEEKE